MVSRIVDGEGSRSLGVDRNQVKLGKRDMRTEVWGRVSHKGNWCSDALVINVEAGQEGCA